MTREAEWQREWEVLRAERDLARRRWRSAADGLAARAQDPLGLGKLVHDHPFAATGIGAAAGAIGGLLAKMLLGRASRGKEAPRPASLWSTVLRDAALSIAVPLLIRTLKEKFGWDLDPAAPPESDPSHRATAEPGTPAARS